MKTFAAHRVMETGPFDDDSWMGGGGCFYCPTDNEEIFRYGLDLSSGVKVKHLRDEVRERFMRRQLFPPENYTKPGDAPSSALRRKGFGNEI